MPIFSVQQKHQNPSGDLHLNPTDPTLPDTRTARARLHDALFGSASSLELPLEADLTQTQAAAILADPAGAIAAFQRVYCVLPPGGLFDNVADIRNWNQSHKWCLQVPETQVRPVGTMRDILRVRLGILPGVSLPAAVPVAGVPAMDDTTVISMLARYPVTPAGDAALRAEFQSIYCAVPSGGFASNGGIDLWNAARPFCAPLPHITTTTTITTGSRARLQTQLGLPSLPGVMDLTDETANAILALPAAQMVDAFRARFCNPPVFYTSGARDEWSLAHPWCAAPAVNYMPWILLGSAVVVGGTAWWLISQKKKSKKHVVA